MHSAPFIQTPPLPGNPYRDDAFLQSYPRRRLPNAQRLVMTLGRALELSLLIEHAAPSAPLGPITAINSEDSARLIE